MMLKKCSKLKLVGKSLGLTLTLVLITASYLSANDSRKSKDLDFLFSANLFSVHGSVSSGQTMVKYSGLASGKGLFLFPESAHHAFLSSGSDDLASELSYTREGVDDSELILEDMVEYICQYLVISDEANQSAGYDLFPMDHIDQFTSDSSDFGLDLFVKVGYDSKNLVQMDAIEVVASWSGTAISTVYNCVDKDFVIGFSSAKINDRLPDGMRVELKANLESATSALLFSVDM